MICFARTVLTEDFYIVQKDTCDMYTWRKAKHIIGDKFIFSSERMLHEGYDRKCSFGQKEKKKETLVVSLKGAWRQDELIGDK
jgi:hypothetical protein